MSQGGEANHSGQFLENAIEQEFKRHGVRVFEYACKGDNGDMFEQQFLLKNVPFVTEYGTNGRSEFVFRSFRGGDVRIECRWQQQSGSVDEKFPYLLKNALRCPEQEVWLVVDGGGAKPEAIAWLKKKAAQIDAKAILVLNLPEVRDRIKHLVRERAA